MRPVSVQPTNRYVLPVTLAGALLTVFITLVTMAAVLRDSAPGIVAMIAPYDSRLHSARALRAVQASGDAAPTVGIERDALAAIRRDPTNVNAFAALALDRVAAGRGTTANALFKHAQSLSRRDLLTNMWFIEWNVARGDVARSLAYYDRALVTSRRAQDHLFPVLTAAIADPTIARTLRPILQRRPIWWRPFLTQAIAAAPSGAVVVPLVAGWLRRDEPNERLLYHQLLVRLAGDLSFDAAFALLRSTDPRLIALLVRNPRFAEQPSLPLFDWTLTDTDILTANLETRGGVSGLSVTVHAGAGGEAARQLVALTPGRYTLSATASTGTGGLTLGLRCADRNATAISRMPLAPNGRPTTAITVIPASCLYQWLFVEVGEAAAIDVDAAPWLTDVRVTREPTA